MKTKVVIALMAAVLMLGQPLCYAGIGRDKYYHVGASAFIGVLMAQNKPFNKWKPWQRILFNVAVIGGCKEWYDSRHPSNRSAEWADIGADAVGALSAEGLIWLYHKDF